MEACRYRVALKKPGVSYCRNPQVFSSLNLVSDQVCNGCQKRSRELPPRGMPTHLDELDGVWRYFRTTDLMIEAHRLARELPDSVDAIVGVARSGLLPAAAVATQLHLPLFSLSPRCGVSDLGTGGRGRALEIRQHPKLVAIVDDSVYGGIAMSEAVKIARERFPYSEILRVAVYVRPEAAQSVDLIGRLAPAPHLFEWNLFNCNQAQNVALDFDGVLCEDWVGDEESEGDRYENHVLAARPLHLPRRSEIPLIVSARLERYRRSTEVWLNRWKIKVNRLVLGDWATAAERKARFRAGEFKGLEYKKSRCSLFVESCERQAEEIFDVARRPVLALSTGKVFH